MLLFFLGASLALVAKIIMGNGKRKGSKKKARKSGGE